MAHKYRAFSTYTGYESRVSAYFSNVQFNKSSGPCSNVIQSSWFRTLVGGKNENLQCLLKAVEEAYDEAKRII